ncbi:MAG: energy-coupling factor transporter transmembrane component T [Elusimicrobiota bacterium]
MRHSYLDKYSELNSPLHRLHPFFKLSVLLSFLILLSTVTFPYFVYGVFFVVIFFLIAISKIPLLFVVSRIGVVLPFLFIISLTHIFGHTDGFNPLFQIFIKSILSVTSLVLFVSTSRFQHLLETLSKAGIPAIVITILSFIYRYFFVLIDEFEKMSFGAKARYFGGKKGGVYQSFPKLIGLLFIRSYERSERIYNAMLMRGYNGETK